MPQRTFTPTKDNFIEGESGSETDTNGTAATIDIQKSITLDNRGLLEFDLASIIGSQIISATISMEVQTVEGADMPFQIDRLVRVTGGEDDDGWGEAISSWNNWRIDGLPDTPIARAWTTAGAGHDGNDIDTTFQITGTMPTSQSGRYTFGTVTTFVQDALDSRAGRTGFRLIQTANRASRVYKFHSLQATDATTHPRLVVNYTYGHRHRIHGLPRTPDGFEGRR